MTQFKITITRHIVGCGNEIQGRVEVLPAPTLVLDEHQRFVLSSSGCWSTSDITAKLAATGISTGINAQSADTTATVISNVIGTITQVAIMAAAGAGPGEVPVAHVELCKTEVAAAVAELFPAAGSGKVPLKAKIDKEIADLAITTARVLLLTTQAKLDTTFKKALVEALADQAKLQAQLAADQAQFTKLLNLTTDVQVVNWPRSADVFRKDDPYLLDEKVFYRWATARADYPGARAQFSVYLALYRLDIAAGEWRQPLKPNAVDDSSGVPVRLPRMGRLLICTKKKCPEGLRMDDNLEENQTASDGVVLQLGQMYVLPVKGGTFRSETAIVSVDANGLPTMVETAEKVAAAAGLTSATKDVATQVAALPGQVRAAQLAKTQAETAQLNANASLASAEANVSVQGQTSSLAAQTALINAQTALATARLNAGLPLETAGITGQTALLNAQAALATAQANARNVDQTSALAAQTTLTNAQTAQVNAAAALAKAQAATP